MTSNPDRAGNRRDTQSADVPATIWPTDNDYGIPVLDLELEARFLDAPLVRWGRETRKSRMSGTWHFYTGDERFSALASRPEQLLRSGCVAACEPNFSVGAQTPKAEAIWATYRKRWLARFWQSHGVRILVDLNVADEHAETNLLGVPQGWGSYATRGSTARLELIEREHERAVERAGRPNILFVVYGGGYAVRGLCYARRWTWISEEADAVRGRSITWGSAATSTRGGGASGA